MDCLGIWPTIAQQSALLSLTHALLAKLAWLETVTLRILSTTSRTGEATLPQIAETLAALIPASAMQRNVWLVLLRIRMKAIL